MAGENLKFVNPSNNAEERANGWILDYAYYSAWKEFVNTNKIDLLTTRDFVQWIVIQPYMSTTERKKKVQILLFLCRLSDGNDHTTRYSVNSDLTALEESLKSINMIEVLLRKSHAETIEALKISVKKQAVLVCCRADDFAAGKEVFQRQFSDISSEDEKTVEEHLQAVLQSGDKNHKYIKFNTYERFLKKAIQCLTVIHDTFSLPYLLQQAESFEKQQQVSDRKNLERKVFSLRSLESTNLKSLTQKGVQNLDSKLEKIREARKRSPADAIQTESTDDSDKEEDYISKKRRSNVNSNGSYTKNRNRNNQQDSNSDEEDVSPLRDRLKLAPESTILQPNKLLRVPWNQRETEVFYEAVREHGVGNWSVIKNNLSTFRTNVQLKDRWRWLVKNKIVLQTLKKKFGPV